MGITGRGFALGSELCRVGFTALRDNNNKSQDGNMAGTFFRLAGCGFRAVLARSAHPQWRPQLAPQAGAVSFGKKNPPLGAYRTSACRFIFLKGHRQHPNRPDPALSENQNHRRHEFCGGALPCGTHRPRWHCHPGRPFFRRLTGGPLRGRRTISPSAPSRRPLPRSLCHLQTCKFRKFQLGKQNQRDAACETYL
jgi:hypothetical protein